MTTFADGLYQYGGTPVASGGLPFPATGTAFFVAPATGSDGNSGKTPTEAFSTIYKGYAACTAGKNDVVFLVGDGATTGTARLSLANAVAANSAATTGTLTWAKAATHLVGVCPPGISARARLSNPTGTYTTTTFNATNMVNVTAAGCYFSNISLVSAFSTGDALEIPWINTGSFNVYTNCSFGFPQSAAALAGTTSRALKVTTGGEVSFNNCMIGTDTVARSVANATLEFAGGTARPWFTDCVFNLRTSAAGSLHMLGTGNNCISSYVLMRRCMFMNATDQGSTAITVAGSFTTASPNGSVILMGSAMIGSGQKWGDTNFLANSYVDNVGGAATAGLMLNPT